MQETGNTTMQGAAAEGLQGSTAAGQGVVEGPSEGAQVGMSRAYAPD